MNFKKYFSAKFLFASSIALLLFRFIVSVLYVFFGNNLGGALYIIANYGSKIGIILFFVGLFLLYLGNRNQNNESVQQEKFSSTKYIIYIIALLVVNFFMLLMLVGKAFHD